MKIKSFFPLYFAALSDEMPYLRVRFTIIVHKATLYAKSLLIIFVIEIFSFNFLNKKISLILL